MSSQVLILYNNKQDGLRKTETICQLDVCDDILVTAQHFKGEILVHTRNYREGENGEKAPKKKGAMIPIDRLKTFIDTFKQNMVSVFRSPSCLLLSISKQPSQFKSAFL
jgi:hypothetical protein